MFDCYCEKLCGFQILGQSLNTTRFIGVRSRILSICLLQNTEDFRSQRNSTAEWSTIEVKPVDQSLESLNSEVIYFVSCLVFWMLESISVTRPITRMF